MIMTHLIPRMACDTESWITGGSLSHGHSDTIRHYTTRTFEYRCDIAIVRARLWSEVVIEESEITCEHNEHASIPTAHVSDCSRRHNLDIPNKSEKYEGQAIPKTMRSSQNTIHSSWYNLFLTYVDSNSCIDGFLQGE
jgi:hypothetical protein